MKFHSLFSGKNRKIFSICHLLKILSKVLSVNIFFFFIVKKMGKDIPEFWELMTAPTTKVNMEKKIE